MFFFVLDNLMFHFVCTKRLFVNDIFFQFELFFKFFLAQRANFPYFIRMFLDKDRQYNDDLSVNNKHIFELYSIKKNGDYKLVQLLERLLMNFHKPCIVESYLK